MRGRCRKNSLPLKPGRCASKSVFCWNVSGNVCPRLFSKNTSAQVCKNTGTLLEFPHKGNRPSALVNQGLTVSHDLQPLYKVHHIWTVHSSNTAHSLVSNHFLCVCVWSKISVNIKFQPLSFGQCFNLEMWAALFGWPHMNHLPEVHRFAVWRLQSSLQPWHHADKQHRQKWAKPCVRGEEGFCQKRTLLGNLFLPQEPEENSFPFPPSGIYGSKFTALFYSPLLCFSALEVSITI